MTGETNGVGSVLGASTAIAGGISVLPNTGGNVFASVLAVLAIVLGGIVIASFISTRLVKIFIR